LLRFYQSCQKLGDEVAENDETYVERNNFKLSEFKLALMAACKSPLMTDIQRFTESFAFLKIATINTKEILFIFV
jgi:hypothetical protein